MSDSPLRIVPKKPDGRDDPPESGPDQAISSSDPVDKEKADMAELRRLLIEPEQIKIDNMLERLNNPRVRAREISRSLSEAIKIRSAEDESLSEALGPTIVDSFQSSIKKNPRPVADAISPLMGPAIRRAITTALNGLIQAFDQTIKYSFSWKGMKWRYEALKTGQSFGQVVLYHTLIFRVEQALLIHKESEVLLRQADSDSVQTRDADLVSGMLMAIKEAVGQFAADSFVDGKAADIPKQPLGDREIWFEQSPFAVLALVIRGNAPESLREEYFTPAMEAIHEEMGETLSSFDGDTEPFALIQDHLESCLQYRLHKDTDPAKYKIPVYIRIIGLLIVLGLGLWGFFAWRSNSRWNDYLDSLKAEPGIVITEEGSESGKRFFAGLRDPLAKDPMEILKTETQIDPDSVVSRLEPYQALIPDFVLQRARRLLSPPDGVELKLENGTLKASGLASQQWIDDAARFSKTIPGIEAFDAAEVLDAETHNLRNRIEAGVIRFVMGKAYPAAGQTQSINELIEDVRQILSKESSIGRTIRINIIGHADSEGDQSLNLRLSRERADWLKSQLTSRGLDKDRIDAKGVGISDPVRPETTEENREFNRSVSFKVTVGALEPAGGVRR